MANREAELKCRRSQLTLGVDIFFFVFDKLPVYTSFNFAQRTTGTKPEVRSDMFTVIANNH